MNITYNIIKELISLINSDSNDDWLRAFNLIKKRTSEDIKTFEAFDLYFKLEKYDIFINNFLYDLDAELNSDGLDDLNLMAKRAEVAKWVYTQFSEEEELTLGNFRNFEAESLWIIGKIEEAKTLFEELIKKFPNFAYGYIIYGDQYWMSDWSYQHGADYEQAEAIYHKALENPHLDHIRDVEDRLKELIKEKKHPEKRTEISELRLKRIQERKE